MGSGLSQPTEPRSSGSGGIRGVTDDCRPGAIPLLGIQVPFAAFAERVCCELLATGELARKRTVEPRNQPRLVLSKASRSSRGAWSRHAFVISSSSSPASIAASLTSTAGKPL